MNAIFTRISTHNEFGAFGTVRWKENGVPICTAGGHQDRPFIVPSVDNQFVVAWLDYREDYGDESSDAIYAQQFNLGGEVGLEGRRCANLHGTGRAVSAVCTKIRIGCYQSGMDGCARRSGRRLHVEILTQQI